jgi:hypothetical protein
MEDITIDALIAQKRVVTTADLLTPTNDYMVVGVYQNGTNKSKGDGTSYKNYVISIAELLGGGSAYTASNGIILVGNDFRLSSQNISQFVNNSGYLLPADLGPYLTSANAALTYQPIGTYLTPTTGWVLDGNTVGSEKFLGTIDNFALPFRTNNVEVARFDTAGNFGIGVLVPTARLHAVGSDATNANYALKVANTLAPIFEVRNDGLVGVGGVNAFTNYKFHIQTSIANDGLQVIGAGVGTLTLGADTDTQSGVLRLRDQPAGNDGWVLRNIGDSYMVNSYNFGIGTGPTAKLHVRSNGSTTGYAFKVENTTPAMLFNVRDDGRVNMGTLPVSAVGLVAGDIWNNAGILTIV